MAVDVGEAVAMVSLAVKTPLAAAMSACLYVFSAELLLIGRRSMGWGWYGAWRCLPDCRPVW